MKEKSRAIRLLDRPVTPALAAEMLNVDPALFRNAPRLLLRDSFRIAMRDALAARQASRAARRSAVILTTTKNKRAAASVPGDLLAMALRIAARQAADRLDGEAGLIATIDPTAADRLRRAAQAAVDAAKADW